jgi:hypothetical protein
MIVLYCVFVAAAAAAAAAADDADADDDAVLEYHLTTMMWIDANVPDYQL